MYEKSRRREEDRGTSSKGKEGVRMTQLTMPEPLGSRGSDRKQKEGHDRDVDRSAPESQGMWGCSATPYGKEKSRGDE